jgi:hypothetical protein
MAPRGNKIDHGVFFLMFAASYHLCTVPLGPPGSSASTLYAIQAPPDHHRSPISPVLLPHPLAPPNMPRNVTNPGEPPGTRIPSPMTIDSQPLSELCLPILATPTDTPTTLSPSCAPQKWRPRPQQCILHRYL